MEIASGTGATGQDSEGTAELRGGTGTSRKGNGAWRTFLVGREWGKGAPSMMHDDGAALMCLELGMGTGSFLS